MFIRVSISICAALWLSAAHITAAAQRPELLVRVGHADSAEVVGFGLDGELIVTRSEDKTAKVWETHSGGLLLTIPSAGPVVLSQDRKFLATGNTDRTIKVWSLKTGQEVSSLNLGLQSPMAKITAITFGPGGKTITGISEDFVGPEESYVTWLHTWVIGTPMGSKRRINRAGRSFYPIFSPDGKFLAGISSSIGDATDPGTLEMWSVPGSKKLYTHTIGTATNSNSYVFSPDGRWLASLSWSDTRVGGIRLLDVMSGKSFLIKSDSELSSELTFSADNELIAGAVSRNNEVRLWNVKTREAVDRKFESDNRVHSLAFSPDGKMLAAGCRVGASEVGSIQLWDVTTGASPRPLGGYRGAIPLVAFSPDSKMIASGGKKEDAGDRTVKLWSVAGGEEISTLEGYPNLTRGIDLSPDGKLLVVKNTSYDLYAGKFITPSFILWDLTRGTGPRSYEGELLAFSQNSENLLIRMQYPDGSTKGCTEDKSPAGRQTFRIDVVDVKTRKRVRTLDGPFCDLEHVVLSPDGNTLAAGGGLAYNGKESVLKFWDLTSGRKKETEIKTNTETISYIVFSPDSKTVVTPDEQNRALKLWNVETGKLVRTFSDARHADDPVSFAAFSTDGRKLVCISGNEPQPSTFRVWRVATGGKPLFKKSSAVGLAPEATFSHDNKILVTAASKVQLWDADTGRLIRTIDIDWSDETEFSTSALFSLDDKLLLTQLNGGSISRGQLWNAARGTELPMLKDESGEVRSATFRRDGQLLASLSTDGVARLWDLKKGKLTASLVALDQNNWLVATPDGRFDGRSAAWKKIFWRFEQNIADAKPVEIFFNEFFYPGLLPDVLAERLSQPPTKLLDKDRSQPLIELTTANKQESEGKMLPSRNVNVKITVTETRASNSRVDNSGARDVRLFRNGTLVKVWKDDVLRGKTSATLDAAVPIVAGENLLTAYAFNRDNIKSEDAALTIMGADSLKRRGTAYVLAIGINEYDNPNYRLSFAVADAETFGEEVRAQQKKLGDYAQTVIVPLLDKDATRANILRALARLAGTDKEPLPENSPLAALKQAQPEDAVVIFFSGHGKAVVDKDSRKGEFYLIPRDMGYAGPRVALRGEALETVKRHSVSDRELQEALTPMDAGRLLMVVDACNSGQALEMADPRQGPMNSRGLAQLAYEKGMYVLAASQGYQSAVESPRYGHGYLTYALVEEGLKTAAADEDGDDLVSIGEWLDYTVRRVPEMQSEREEECKADIECLSSDRPELVGQLRVQQERQRPKVFYKRENESTPWVIAKTGTR